MSAAELVMNGSLLVAIPVATAAGVISFLSPCVLPLVPGYLSYMTGMTGAELAGDIEQRGGSHGEAGSQATAGSAGAVATLATQPTERSPGRSRVLLGTLLFVLGFSTVFVSYGLLFGTLGGLLLEHQRTISVVLGLIVILMGAGYLGLVPAMAREVRWHHRPSRGLWGAPLLGFLFGLGWTPCIGPTLAAVQTLAFTEGSAARGALLSFAYCLGLGLPFVAMGLAYRRALSSMAWVRKRSRTISAIGGAMLVVIGVLLITGLWGEVTRSMAGWIGGWESPL